MPKGTSKSRGASGAARGSARGRGRGRGRGGARGGIVGARGVGPGGLLPDVFGEARDEAQVEVEGYNPCLLYTSPSPRDS